MCLRVAGKSSELTGYGVGNLDGVKTVELCFDDGKTWQSASLFSNPSPLVWTFWKYVWVNPAPGTYRIVVRAVDRKGRVEAWEPRNIFPDGATGQQVLKVTVL
jgi:hypothetical protein